LWLVFDWRSNGALRDIAAVPVADSVRRGAGAIQKGQAMSPLVPIDLFTRQDASPTKRKTRQASTAKEELAKLSKLHAMKIGDTIVGMDKPLSSLKVIKLGLCGFEVEWEGVNCVYFWTDEGTKWRRS
jgi:hypothetical protein